MPSPFPGMNPYLERKYVWNDFHQAYILRLRDALNTLVLPKYFVKVEEYVYLHEAPPERETIGKPDVSVVESKPTGVDVAGTAMVEAPARTLVPTVAEEERSAYLEVLDRESHRLVTAVELLSPSNKAFGVDRDHYLRKRLSLFRRGVNLVEIDLLRGGPRMPFAELPACDYCVMVSRAENLPEVDVWPIRLREPLPRVPVPLRAPDSDAILDLQAALHAVYDAAGYEVYAYETEPQPPLEGADAEWAQEIVASLRTA